MNKEAVRSFSLSNMEEDQLEISEFEVAVESGETFGLIKRLKDDTEEIRTLFYLILEILTVYNSTIAAYGGQPILSAVELV